MTQFAIVDPSGRVEDGLEDYSVTVFDDPAVYARRRRQSLARARRLDTLLERHPLVRRYCRYSHGWPDPLAATPGWVLSLAGGHCAWVVLVAPGVALTPVQRRFLARAQQTGHGVCIAGTAAQVKTYLDQLQAVLNGEDSHD